MTSVSISPPPNVAQATLTPVPASSGPVAAPWPGFAAMLLPVAADAAEGAPVASGAPAAGEGGTGPPPDGNVLPLASPWLPPPVATVQPVPPGLAAGRPGGTRQELPAAPAAPGPAATAATVLAALAAPGDGTDQPVQGVAPHATAATAAAATGTALAAMPPAAAGPGATEQVDTAASGPGLPPADGRADLTEPVVEPRLARFLAGQGVEAGPRPEGDTRLSSVPLGSGESAVDPALAALVTAEGEPPANAAGSPANAAVAPAPPMRAPAPAAVMQLATPVGAEPFGQELGERVAWMVGRDLTTAQLKLNPPQLGPVEVRVQVSGDQASVSLSAHNFVARDALEQAIPRLRDMLGAQGFTQVDVNVAQHSFQERPAQPGRYDRDDAPLAEVAVELPAPAIARSARAAMTLVDTYA